LETDGYAFSSVLLHGALPSPVRCYVLMPLRPVNSFLQRLDHTIFLLGASAVLFGALLFGFVSRTITQPLDNLVAGVRALAGGDFSYSITRQGSSSISHDLRHFLAAVVANAEFLYEADTLKLDKNEIYQEIKAASEQMTDLIDSLRELSYQRSTISPEPTHLDQVIQHAVEAVKVRPEFRNCAITVNSDGQLEGEFDPRKLERAFFNLILNACEATGGAESIVNVEIHADKDSFDIRVTDHGPGVPENIREKLFDPFVSSGKPNGTGLGLAIVSKIISDHGGSVSIERTSQDGTVMLVKLPRAAASVPTQKNSAVV
jgi:signal transduction histidine kinase